VVPRTSQRVAGESLRREAGDLENVTSVGRLNKYG